ncbi:Uncharacterized protein APZ42_008452, partial [Daphnia magna]
MICVDGWRADGYRWRNNGCHTFNSGILATHFLLITGPKKHGKYSTTSDFTRSVYCHPNIPSRKFIRYCGDDTAVTQFPHGNSKWKAKLTTLYVCTNPDLFDEIRKKNGASSTIFRKLLTEGPKDLIRHLVDAPCDIEQVGNIKKNQRRSDRFCHDAFYNIIDLKAEVKEFITYYRLFPNVVVFGCNDALLTKLRAILGRKDLPNQMLTVDTTFKLGDFYCTVLIFVETDLKKNPSS